MLVMNPMEFDRTTRSEIMSIPSKRLNNLDEIYANELSLSEFVVYEFPKPRNYGQAYSYYERYTEPQKIRLVSPNDFDWRIAVENYFLSDAFVYEPYISNSVIREPLLSQRTLRVKSARLLLPSKGSVLPTHSTAYSDFVFCYFIDLPDEKSGKTIRRYIDPLILDGAYHREPISWHSTKRSHTIPTDWLSNRIADLDRYAKFA
jgi:hypothetical protein